MKTPSTLYETALKSLKFKARGKVRDIYEIDDQDMLIVTTDRISAFDVILPNPIPGKGQVLTAVTNFWFDKIQSTIPNHLSAKTLSQVVPDKTECQLIKGRAIVVKKLNPLPIEAIVRGYLIGSGWKDYQTSGTVCGIRLPEGLRQAEKLPKAIYTPSTKAEVGEHDANISFEKTVSLLGQEMAKSVRKISLKLYTDAAKYAYERGIIIADTKFEFGLDNNENLYLIDEVLTPDSSRFWPVDEYQVGISPPSFDKQFVRDYLETLNWDKKAPGPKLPNEVIQKSAEKYKEAQKRLTDDNRQ